MARGPAYPFVDLEQAVDFARRMYQFTRRSPADANAVITEAWSYSPTSSGSKKLVAALKYFGLIEDVSDGDGKAIRLTDRAYRILVDDPTSSERRQALHDAVLSPKAYQLCWARWGKDMPLSMKSNLIFNEGFIESTVDGFIEDYKKSIEYAGLAQEDPSEINQVESTIPEATSPKFEGTSPQTHSRLVNTPQLPSSFDPETRSDIFSLNEGTVSLSWPRYLSQESFQDLSDWLDLMKRKIERTAKITD